MTQSLHPAAKQGFSSSAALYQAVRPDYPDALINWLKAHLVLPPAPYFLDLGAGTGKFLPTLKTLNAPSRIYAIDPVPEMLAQLKTTHPDILTFIANSDDLPLSDQNQDAVFCAQSFHWFANQESLNSIARVLKTKGYLVLVWNQRDIQVDWVKALADLILPLEGDTPRYHSGAWQQLMHAQNLFQLVNHTQIRQYHVGTVEQVVSKRLLSTSFITALPESERHALKQQFEDIVERYTHQNKDAQIEFPYITHVYVYQKCDDLSR